MKKIGIIIAVLLTLLVVAGCQNKKDTQKINLQIIGKCKHKKQGI